MEINKAASVGTLESSDVLISIQPDNGIKIEVESDVMKQYGDRIERIVKDTINSFKIENIHIKVKDQGALDYTIKARLETALKRASESK
jgi:citrate lyase subunit gamma (acyl carrier protein)